MAARVLDGAVRWFGLVSALRVVCVGLLLVTLIGCGYTVQQHVVGQASPTAEVPAPVVAQPVVAAIPARLDLGSAPADVRAVDWNSVALPGEFCDIDGLVTVENGEATARSGEWGRVHVDIWNDSTTYGDVDGDGDEEAALEVGCDTGGGTAASQLVNAYVVVDSSGGRLWGAGVLTPQGESGGAVPARLEDLQFGEGRVTVRELWHREWDSNCCPSGEAESTWELRDGVLEPAGIVEIS